MRFNKGLGKKRLIQLSFVVALVLWSCSGLIRPVMSASEEPVEAEKPAEQANESADSQDESAERTESSEESNGELSERGSSGEEEKPDVEDEEKTESKKQPEKEKDEDAEESSKQKKRIIGATAKILEKESGLIFKARVDTGAKSCSLHVEEMKVVGEVEGWKENIGKVVRFKVRNGSDKTKPIECRIKNFVLIKTSGHVERRYKVPLTLSWNGGAVEKKVLVTLNDRKGMDYPLLLGRNFLSGDFLVDVDLNSSD